MRDYDEAEYLVREVGQIAQRLKPTGDHSEDLQKLLKTKHFPEKWHTYLTTLDEKITACSGEPFLVVYEQGHDHRGGCVESFFPEIETTLALGFLEGELGINYKTLDLLFPMVKFAHKGEKMIGYDREKLKEKEGEFAIAFSNKTWTRVSGQMHLQFASLAFVNRDIVHHEEGGGCMGYGDLVASGMSVHILPGEKAVHAYFTVEGRSPFMSGLFWDTMQRIVKGEASQAFLEHCTNNQNHWDLDYIAALRCLGTQMPEMFLHEEERRDTKKRTDVLEKLLRNAPKKGEEFSKGLEDSVKVALKEAVELDMHKKQWSFDLQPGITVNVPEYVTRLCEQYKVRLQE